VRTLYISKRVDTRLTEALRQAGHAIHALHPDEANWAIAESRHQIIVYDTEAAELPRLCQWTRLRPPHAVLLTILGANSRTTVAAVLRAGADACLRKPLSLLELEARIQALLRRAVIDTGLQGPAPAADQLTIGMRAHVATYAGRQLALAPREHALLFLLVRARGRAISRETICEHLWFDADEPRPERVDLYISRLRRKLTRLGAPNTVHTLRGFGYRLQGPVALH
jgi:DNA-binding response OmpR family regulator